MVSEHLLCAKHCAIHTHTHTHTHTQDIVINKSEVVSFLENISMSLERGDKQLKKNHNSAGKCCDRGNERYMERRSTCPRPRIEGL